MLYAVLALAVLLCAVVWVRRSPLFSSPFPYRPGAGPYFLSDGCLVLNYRIPQVFPLADIARVEFLHGEREALLVHITLRNGTKRGVRYQNPPPELETQWRRDLEGAGIRCLRL